MLGKLLTVVFSSSLLVSTAQALQVTPLIHTANIKPGETQNVQITLINDGDAADQVQLKLVDYSSNTEGYTFHDDYGNLPRSNAKWVSLSERQITLKPKEQHAFAYTIRAPSDPHLKGSYWSVLLIESNVKVRFTHHIISNVGTSIDAKLKVIDKQVKEISGQRYLCIDVANQGELSLHPKVSLRLYNEDGTFKTTLEGAAEHIYPDYSQRYFLSIDTLPSEKFTGFLLIDNGDEHLFGDSFSIQL